MAENEPAESTEKAPLSEEQPEEQLADDDDVVAAATEVTTATAEEDDVGVVDASALVEATAAAITTDHHPTTTTVTGTSSAEAAAATTAVAVSYATQLGHPSQQSEIAAAAAASTLHNKWSRNGYGAPVLRQSGKFSKEESELVKNSIEEYCTAKQISVSRLCSECDHKAELKGAWMEIAKRLPHRSVQSVYRHGIRQCHPFKRGAWSEQEIIALQDLVTRMGKKWAAIQSKLNRSADACRDKYREMDDNYVKGRWKEEETESLRHVIREQVKSLTNGATEAITDMKELGHFVEEQNIQIPWSTVSKKMGQRSRLSCFKKWQKMTGLFSPADVKKGSGGGATTTTTTIQQQHVPPTGGDDNDDDEQQVQPPAAKRIKTESSSSAPTAGAAAAAAIVAAEGGNNKEAELAAETVEALELPDTEALAGTAAAAAATTTASV